MAKIRIERSSEWNNKGRKIGVYINDIKVGTVNDGETVEYEVESGVNEVCCKIDWCRSPKIKLNSVQNETKTLSLNGFKYGVYIIRITLGLLLLYYLLSYAFQLQVNFLIIVIAMGFLYPLYFITLGKDKYLRLIESVTK